jgi:DNA-binding MarR family transcriptional regulator
MEPFSVPRSIWESLEAVLHAKGQQLAKEIAKELKVQPQPLMAHLKAMELGKFILLPDTEDTLYQCEALLPQGQLLLRCKKPVFSEDHLCSEHKGSSTSAPNTQPVTRLSIGDTIYVLHGTRIETLEGVVCGMKHGQRVTLFDLTE